MYKFLGRSVLIAALVTFTGVVAFAQRDKDRSMTCRENTYYNDRLVSNCEIREQKLGASGGAVGVGGKGGRGKREDEVRAGGRGRRRAPTVAEAEALGKQVRIETSGAKIYATGPERK